MLLKLTSWNALTGRLFIGLAQGVTLYVLYRLWQGGPWSAGQRLALVLAGLLAVYLGPLALIAVGSGLRRGSLLIWLGIAALLLLGIGWHADARTVFGLASDGPPWFSGVPLSLLIYVAQVLVIAADVSRRVPPPYPLMFDAAWRTLSLLLLGALFTVAIWAVLALGAALFGVIGLDWLEQLISEEWFSIPVTPLAFALGVHLAADRGPLLANLRNLVLLQAAWLLPLLGVITLGFLGALLVTGLQPLWETGHATAVILAAILALVLLLNAAYQDGTQSLLLLRVVVRVMAVALVPLALLCLLGLGLRVQQYGLTPSRVWAAWAVAMGLIYALGYAAAALWPLVAQGARWMQGLEITNLAGAVALVLSLVLLFSPLLDPARLSVSNQLGRLAGGRVTPEHFDYAMLRDEGEVWGASALQKLIAAGGPGAELAEAARTRSATAAAKPPQQDRAALITVYPAGTSLPASFLRQDKSTLGWQQPCVRGTGHCDAYRMDLNGDGRPEILLGSGGTLQVYTQAADGGPWRNVGDLSLYGCPGIAEALRRGDAHPAAPQWQDVEAGGYRLRLELSTSCVTPSAH